MHAAAVGLAKKSFKILVCAIARSYFIIVTHIISGVGKGRIKARIQPYSVAAKPAYIIKLTDYTVNIAYAVAV